MLLALSIISSQGASMGQLAYKIFDERGGSIGRLDSNDWALPDPERFVSSRHAVIRFLGGAFCLEDVSTNGTFLNAPDRPASRREPTRLSDGDRIYIGDYEILAQLIEDGVPAAADPIPVSAPMQPRRVEAPAETHAPGTALSAASVSAAPVDDPLAVIGVVRAAPNAPVQELPQAMRSVQPESLAPIAPFPKGSAPGDSAMREVAPSSFLPEDAVLTLFSRDRVPTPGPERMPILEHPSPPDSRVAAAAVSPAPLGASVAPSPPAPSYAAATAASAGAYVTAGSAAAASAGAAEPASASDFFTALGLDPRAVDPATTQQLAAIIRTVVQGMIEVLRARNEVKNNFRMSMTSLQAIENNPLKFSLNAEDALHNLFVKRNPGYLGPFEAFHEGFQDIAFHELAMLAGIRAAYQAMLAKFNPAHLEEVYTRKLKRTSMLNLGPRLKFWDMYCAQFEDIDKDAEANFQLLFGEDFAKAYHEQLNKLIQAARVRKR